VQSQDEITALISLNADSAYTGVAQEFSRAAALDVMSLCFRHRMDLVRLIRLT
jgi:hypothetical protein